MLVKPLHRGQLPRSCSIQQRRPTDLGVSFLFFGGETSTPNSAGRCTFTHIHAHTVMCMGASLQVDVRYRGSQSGARNVYLVLNGKVGSCPSCCCELGDVARLGSFEDVGRYRGRLHTAPHHSTPQHIFTFTFTTLSNSAAHFQNRKQQYDAVATASVGHIMRQRHSSGHDRHRHTTAPLWWSW